MVKGEILYSPSHQFEDGSTSNKLLILLNDPNTSSTYLLALATSQPKSWRKNNPGCHHDSSESYYIINQNVDFFTVKTWILFNTIEMLSSDEVNQEITNGNLASKAILQSSTINAIINCASTSPDISGFMIELLNK